MSDRQYDNNLSGVLFRNDKEGGNASWPDYRGQCEINGVAYWIDSWIKESKKDGKKFMSLKFKPKLASQHQGAPANPPAQKRDDFEDSEIPF